MQIRDRSHQSVSDLVLGSIDPFCRGESGAEVLRTNQCNERVNGFNQ